MNHMNILNYKQEVIWPYFAKSEMQRRENLKVGLQTRH
jgi:hypothetical protein